MADESGNRALIETAVARARSRWLVSAVVNAGGRWAALPAGVAALVGIALALSGVHTIGWLLVVSLLGAAGVAATLLLTHRLYARPAAAGAPDWTLLLDRALDADDALPTMLESSGEFRALMEARVAAKLDPVREKLATPARHWGAVIVALILALMPLVFWRPTPEAPAEPTEVAKTEPTSAATQQTPTGDGPGEADGNGAGKSDAPGPADAGKGGGGKDGEVAKRPDEGKSDGGAGEKPEDVKPKPAENDSQPKEGGTGDKPNQPPPPPNQPDEEVESDLNHVKPVAGDGETRDEDRKHWVYNPDGDKLDGSTPSPRDVQHPGEKSVPRTKLTTRERRQLEALYKKLYE